MRNDPRSFTVRIEDSCIPTQAINTLLDAGPTRVVQGDKGAAVAEGHPHRLHDLVGMHLTEGTPHHTGVLSCDKDLASVDQAKAGHDAITVA